jgi:microcystin-dependent protein
VAAYPTDRLKIIRWENNTDDFTRAQMDDSHRLLEDQVAIFTSGTSFPSGGGTSQYSRSFYLDTVNNIIYYSFNDGASWRALNQYAAPTTTLAPGGANAEGNATSVARSNHSHALPAWGQTNQVAAIGTANGAGTAENFARADHVHVLGAGSINSSTYLANGVIATAALADGSVSNQKIAANAVSRDKISQNQRIPIGAIIPFAGVTAPVGWALCDGTSRNYETQPEFYELWLEIQYRYGGSGLVFNLPNLIDRVPRGATSGNVGVSGGQNSITLTQSQMPLHNHSIAPTVTSEGGVHNHGFDPLAAMGSAGSHSHQAATNGAHNHGSWTGRQFIYENLSSAFKLTLGGTYGVSIMQFNDHNGHVHNTDTQGSHQHSLQSVTTLNSVSHTHTVSGDTGNAGLNASVDIRPQFLGLSYIIKL